MMTRAISLTCQLFLFCAVLLSQLTYAESLVNDELLRNSKRVYSDDWTEREYRLVSSSVKKINGQWFADRQKVINGLVSRSTYELDALFTFRAVKRLLQDRLNQIPQEHILFACDGLDCGSSNAWANEFFHIKQLYGLDTKQFYAVVQNAERFQILYLVQRGNKRIYLQVDEVKQSSAGLTSPAQEPRVEQALLNQGYWVVPAELFNRNRAPEIEKHLLQPVVELLQRQPGWRIAVVGHSAAGTDAGMALAKRVTNGLQRLGVQASQVESHSVGALAPRANIRSERVEIVLLR